MATRKSSFTKKQKSAVETSESINLQVEEFLKTGGQIEQIKSGVSGLEPKTGRKHITIASKNSTA